MSSALWISKTGLAAQDKAMSTVANNLANVNTTGFKSDRVVFEDLFYTIEVPPGAQADAVRRGMAAGTPGAVLPLNEGQPDLAELVAAVVRLTNRETSP